MAYQNKRTQAKPHKDLENVLKYTGDISTPYDLELPYSSRWKQANRRVLIILQTVPTESLEEKQLVCGNTSVALHNVIKYSEGYASKVLGGQQVPDYEIAVINFNAAPHLHLKGNDRTNAERKFATRCHALIEKMKPTDIFVSGDNAMAMLYPQIENAYVMRGRPHQVGKYMVTSTLDFSRLMERKGEYANLLGFWSRHFAHCLMRRHPIDLSGIKANPVYIDTIEKFKEMVEVLMASKVIGFDSESTNLSVLNNAIYTVQFCGDKRPDVGYIVPVDHPMTPWLKPELVRVKKWLRNFFSTHDAKLQKELVTFNGLFDLRLIKQCLRIPIIYHKMWEVMYGEAGLDENRADLASAANLKVGGLAPTFASYGNNFYYNAEFSKDQRDTLVAVDINTDIPAQEYMAMDAQAVLAMRQAQLKLSEFQTITRHRHPYTKYFHRHMLYQMSDQVHQSVQLKQDGSRVSLEKLKELNKADSKIMQELQELEDSFRFEPDVVEANNRLLKKAGIVAGSLWKKKKDAPSKWMFRFSKPEHLQMLFFEVMGLPVVATTSTGLPSTGADFLEAFKDSNAFVDRYADYAKLRTIVQTYIRGWLDKIQNDPDARKDHHMRADYDIVTTGRLSSANPNLQNIPSRGALAKIIKELFEVEGAEARTYAELLNADISIRYDVNASEIRALSYVSGDEIFAQAFYVGLKLRQEYLLDPTPEKLKEIKVKGDIHVANVLRLLGKAITKDDPLRDAIKAIVFGLIYGKADKTLGDDTKTAERNEIKAKIRANRDNEEEVLKLSKQLTALVEENREEYAADLKAKLFKEFKKSGAWLERTKEDAEEIYEVFAPNGRKRSLYAVMTGVKSIVSQQVRRGSNAPIQGFASEISSKAGRQIALAYFDHLRDIYEMLFGEVDDWSIDDEWEYRFRFNRTVHDANYYTTKLWMALPFIHIAQYQATYGITQAYKDEFNINFTVPPEIEVEVGYNDAKTEKWDYSVPQLVASLEKVTKARYGEGKEFKTAMRIILKPWHDKRCRSYLQSHSPLLNMDDAAIEKQMVAAVAPYFAD